MARIIFLLSILRKESRERFFIIKSLLWSFVFLHVALLLVNYKNIFSVLGSDYKIPAKVSILWTLFWGAFQTITPLDVALLLTSSLLFGTNLALVMRKIKFLAGQGSLKLTFGTGLITLVATGCASCGLSFISLFGLGGIVALLPFGGVELYIASILILTFLLFYNLNSYVKACKIR